MGIPVLIIGETGSGKTFSIKTFRPEDVTIFSVEKNRLPFRCAGYEVIKNANYRSIFDGMRDSKKKSFVIDDSQYLLVNELFNRVSETGYQKYTEMAVKFKSLVKAVNERLPDDVIVYFMHHPEYDSTSGKYKAKTVGKMIDQYWTVEGSFDIVLYAKTDGENYVFQTKTDGSNTAKAPEDMFPKEIANDLAMVDRTIREYYGI